MSEGMNPQLDPAADATTTSDDSSFLDEATQTESANSGQSGSDARTKIAEEKFQSKYDKVRKEGGNLLSSRYWQELGGEGIKRALEQFEAMLEHTDTAQSVKEHLVQNAEGRWVYKPTSQARATAEAVDGDAFEDPVLKQMDARLEARLGPLIDKINSLAPQMNTLASENATAKIEQFVQRFRKEYPLSPEEAADFSEAIGPAISGMNPQVLLKMNYDQFEDYVAFPRIKKNLVSILARKARTNGSRLAGLATDGVGSQGQGAESASAGKQPVMTIQQLKKHLAAAATRASQEPQ